MKNLKSILFTAAASISTLLFAVSASAAAPAGSVPWNGHLYKVFNESCKWTEARDFCEAQDGHLVTITSPPEQAFVMELINQYGTKDNYWIGATDRDKEGSWEWVTGEPFAYTNWKPGQPNNDTCIDSSGQDYGLVHHSANAQKEGIDGKWEDMPNSGRSVYDFRTAYKLDTPYYGFVLEWDNTTASLIDLSQAVVTLNKTQYTYNGSARTPKIKSVKLEVLDEDTTKTKTLKEGTDYSVDYLDNIEPGIASVRITGTGDYKGSAYACFNITPKAPTKISLTGTSCGFQMDFVAAEGSGLDYEVRYSTSRAFIYFADPVKLHRKTGISFNEVTIPSSSSKSTYLCDGLKAKTKYYVQVRTCAGDLYSSWSSVCNVKTKK